MLIPLDEKKLFRLKKKCFLASENVRAVFTPGLLAQSDRENGANLVSDAGLRTRIIGSEGPRRVTGQFSQG